MDRDEWRLWRHKGIGGSDAAAVWGESPYKTAYQLWEEKTQEKPPEERSNFILEKGHRVEPLARRQFAARYNMDHETDEIFSAATFVMDDLPFMRCSLDGCSQSVEKRIILELKLQGREAFAALRDHKVVPRHYWIQVQHNMLVSGSREAYYGATTNGKDFADVRVEFDYEFGRKHIKNCSEFWEMVQKKKAPPFSDQDYKRLSKRGAKGLASKYHRLSQKIAALTEERDQIKDELLAMCDHPRMKCNGLRIQQISKKGSINYRSIMKLPEVQALNLNEEEFRSKASSYWKIIHEL